MSNPADRLAAIERYSFSSEAGVRIETDEGWVRFSDAQSVIEGLLAELRTLQQQRDAWRSWAQFVYLSGGQPEGTDAELQRRVCEAQDAQVRDHSQCHDLVCNGDRTKPRGEKGSSCSCRGRDSAYQEMQQWRENFNAGLNVAAEYRQEIRDLKAQLGVLQQQIAHLTDQRTTLQEDLQQWEEREAKVCPEDVGFEEYIRTLQKRLAALSAEREPEKP